MSSWEGQVGMKWGESVQTDTMKSTKTNWNQKDRLEPTAVSHCLQPCWCGRPAGEACSLHYGDTHVLGLGVGGAEGGDSFVPEGLWVQLKPHANKWTSRPASKSAKLQQSLASYANLQNTVAAMCDISTFQISLQISPHPYRKFRSIEKRKFLIM